MPRPRAPRRRTTYTPRTARPGTHYPAPSLPVTMLLTIGVILLVAIIGGVINSINGTSNTTPPSTFTFPTDTPAPTATDAPVPTPLPLWAPGSDPACNDYVNPPPGLHCIPYGTTPAACTTLNCNPWGYDFNPGNLIYSPPSAFCSYFSCIASFWDGSGYVVECQDSEYSKSGGIQGVCSQHGGYQRTLYSH